MKRPKIAKNFTIIPNEMPRSRAMSFAARGILTMMLTHEPGWRMGIKDFVAFKFESRRVIRAAVHELESLGYATRKPIKSKEGGFKGVSWEWRGIPAPPAKKQPPPPQTSTSPSDQIRSHIRRSYASYEDWRTDWLFELFKDAPMDAQPCPRVPPQEYIPFSGHERGPMPSVTPEPITQPLESWVYPF